MASLPEVDCASDSVKRRSPVLPAAYGTVSRLEQLSHGQRRNKSTVAPNRSTPAETDAPDGRYGRSAVVGTRRASARNQKSGDEAARAAVQAEEMLNDLVAVRLNMKGWEVAESEQDASEDLIEAYSEARRREANDEDSIESIRYVTAAAAADSLPEVVRCDGVSVDGGDRWRGAGEESDECGDEGSGARGRERGAGNGPPRPSKVKEVVEVAKEHYTTYVRAPFFPGTEPTVAFSADQGSFEREGLMPITKKIWVRFGGIANSPVKNALTVAGLRRTKGSHFNLFWTAALGRDSSWWKVLNRYQRVNHFPGTWELGRKDKLYKNVAAMRRAKGAEFDFVPSFFILPREYDEYQHDVERHPGAMYIQKPLASSRGRGIKMVVKPKEMPRDATVLVQRYIRNPLLIGGFKFDIRLYCVVTCFDPLKVYLYEDGLARFATEKYTNDSSHLKKRCVHLTNYSVNKKKQGFVAAESEEEDGSGSKWSLEALRRHLESTGTPWSVVWDQFRAIVAKTIIAVEPKINTLVKMVVPHRNVCFEVFGFDLMLDTNLRAWLIEVNTGPSLGAQASAHIDRKVKFPMVADMLNLIGLTPYDREVFEREEEAKRHARLTGLGEQESRVRHRDVRDAQDAVFRGLAPEELPEIVREAEAELGRKGRFHRVFPVPEDPSRFLDLFDAPRYNTTLICRYYEEKLAAGMGRAHGRPVSGRRATSASPSASPASRGTAPLRSPPLSAPPYHATNGIKSGLGSQSGKSRRQATASPSPRLPRSNSGVSSEGSSSGGGKPGGRSRSVKRVGRLPDGPLPPPRRASSVSRPTASARRRPS